MKRLLAALLLTACSSLFTGAAFAQAKPEDAIKYRQGVYRVIGWNFGPMAAMAKTNRDEGRGTRDESIQRLKVL